MEHCGILAGVLLYYIYSMKHGNCNTLPSDWKSRIHSSVLRNFDARNTTADWPSGSDIIEDESPAERFMKAGVESNGQMFPYNYWPNNGKCIPFRLHPSFDRDIEARRSILDAMRKIERRTHSCITFKTWSVEPEYISIRPGRHCESDVGRTPGTITRVRLGRECMKEGIILHELMHALGFFHEHARPDRDDFLEIFPDRVQSGKYDPNFIIMKNMSDYGIQYDFESIMHYAPWAFAQNPNKPTMLPKVHTPVKMGQQQYLSALDVTKLEKAYGCIGEDHEPLPGAAPSTCAVDTDLKEPELPRTAPTTSRPTGVLQSGNSDKSGKDRKPSWLGSVSDWWSGGQTSQATICGLSCSVLTKEQICNGRPTSKKYIQCPDSDVEVKCRTEIGAARDALRGTIEALRARGNRQAECAD